MAAAFVLGGTNANAETFRWMTGSPGGSFYPLGGALKGFMEAENSDMKFEIMHGGGLANLRGVQENKAVLGFANSVTTVDALKGTAPFNKPHTEVCNVASLYPQFFQMITLDEHKNIQSVGDYKGKSIASQTRGTTGEAFLRAILDVSDMSYDSLSKLHQVGFNDAVNLMKDNHAEVFTLVTTIPAGAVMDLATARKIRIVPVDDGTYQKLKATMPGLKFGAIPANTYPGVDKDVPALTWSAHIVTRCDAPEDMIYTLTKTILAHANELGGVAKAVKGLDIKRMSADVSVPFHAGAAKFYKENGITVK